MGFLLSYQWQIYYFFIPTKVGIPASYAEIPTFVGMTVPFICHLDEGEIPDRFITDFSSCVVEMAVLT